MGGKVQMIFEGDEAKLVQSLDRQTAKLKKLEAEFDKVKQAGKNAGDSAAAGGDKASKAFSALGGPAGPLAATVAGVGLLIKSIRDMNAEAERGANLLKQAADPMGKLAQLSGGGQAGLNQRIRLARDLAVGGGIGLEAAAQTVFDATSLGISESEVRGLFSGGRLGKEYIPSALRGGGKIREAFGAGETGSLMEIVNKAQAAADKSDVDFAGILMNTLAFAPAAARIGTRDEEALAALSILSGPGGKEPAEAATLIGAFTGMLGKAGGFTGGIGEGVARLAGMSEEDRNKVLGGRKEARAAYDLLRVRQDLLRERTGEIDLAASLTGTAASPFNQAVGRARNNVILGGEFENRQESIALALAEAGYFGAGRLGTQAARARAARMRIEEGEIPIQRHLRGYAGGLAEMAGGGVDEVRTAEANPALAGPVSPGVAVLQYHLWALNKMKGLFGGGGGGDAFEAGGGGGWVDKLSAAADALLEAARRAPSVEDRRTQIFYGSPNEGAQMRSPSGRRDPTTGS